MNPLFLAISSGIILSFDQVLIKLFLNKYEIQDFYKLLNFKPLVLIIVIGSIGLFGSILWFLALQKSELSKIYWVTSLYYITIFGWWLRASRWFPGPFIIPNGSSWLGEYPRSPEMFKKHRKI